MFLRYGELTHGMSVTVCLAFEFYVLPRTTLHITPISVRMLTKRIRKNGSMLAKIEFEEQAIEFDDPNVRNLIKEVSVTEKKVLELSVRLIQ